MCGIVIKIRNLILHDPQILNGPKTTNLVYNNNFPEVIVYTLSWIYCVVSARLSNDWVYMLNVNLGSVRFLEIDDLGVLLPHYFTTNKSKMWNHI